jgi:hypothetical protein
MKTTNTFWEQNTGHFNLESGGTYSYHCTLTEQTDVEP